MEGIPLIKYFNNYEVVTFTELYGGLQAVPGSGSEGQYQAL